MSSSAKQRMKDDLFKKVSGIISLNYDDNDDDALYWVIIIDCNYLPTDRMVSIEMTLLVANKASSAKDVMLHRRVALLPCR